MSAFKLVLTDELPWMKLGPVYFFMAAVCSLPMVGRGLIIYNHLKLPPETSTTFYMVTWLPSLTAPIFGRLSDVHAPSRRYIATASLLVEAAFQLFYAADLVNSLGTLYAVAIPISLAHVAAQACVDGILVSGRGGGETGVARARQAAMVTFSVAGDIVACLISLLIQVVDGTHTGGGSDTNSTHSSCTPEPAAALLPPPSIPPAVAPPPLSPLNPLSPPPPSSPWSPWSPSASLVAASFVVTSALCVSAAILVFMLPVSGRSSSSSSSILLEAASSRPALEITEAEDGGATTTIEGAAAPRLADAKTVEPQASADGTVTSCTVWRERLVSALGGPRAILAALVAVVYMLSPTSGDALSAYIYQEVTIPTSLLTAQQMSGLFGTLLGGCTVWWLDWPLSRLLPLGAVATSLSAISGLWLVLARESISMCRPWGYVTLLAQPLVSGFLGRVGFMPLYSLGAAASTRAREGGSYALVMAAQALAGEASAGISVAIISAMRVGAPSAADDPNDPNGRSWAHLPHLLVLCSLCKLAAGPLAVIIWRAGRGRTADADGDGA
jgi:hypothetical protein